MTRRAPVNIPASILARLKGLADRRGVTHQSLLGAYARERFLYRLGASSRGRGFVLKGAMLFVLWEGEPHRPTMDVDLLGPGHAAGGGVADVLAAVVGAECPEDGVRFDPGSIRSDPIRTTGAYGGLRVRMEASIGSARVPIRVDIGFGDAVTPKPRRASFPTLLDLPPPRIPVYPRETVVSEKVHAMAVLGLANTRMKDLFDVRALAAAFPFDGRTLRRAMEATFRRRRTSFTGEPLPVLTAAFREDPARDRLWEAFLSRGSLVGVPGGLGAVQADLGRFLEPVLETLARGAPFSARWPAGGPWKR